MWIFLVAYFPYTVTISKAIICQDHFKKWPKQCHDDKLYLLTPLTVNILGIVACFLFVRNISCHLCSPSRLSRFGCHCRTNHSYLNPVLVLWAIEAATVHRTECHKMWHIQDSFSCLHFVYVLMCIFLCCSCCITPGLLTFLYSPEHSTSCSAFSLNCTLIFQDTI